MLALTASSSAVEFSALEFAGQRFTVARVQVHRERLELFHRDARGQSWRSFSALESWTQTQGRKLVFAMNAGMFHRDLSPVGLFVADGKEVVPLNAASGEGNFYLKPNGVFALGAAGARVIESSEYSKLKERERVTWATQSGPLLVAAGKIHPAFRENSSSRHFRNGVGVPSPDIAIFAISESPVNFYELATLFRDRLKCPDALYLDGAISSLHAPKLKRSDVRADLGPLIAVTE